MAIALRLGNQPASLQAASARVTNTNTHKKCAAGRGAVGKDSRFFPVGFRIHISRTGQHAKLVLTSYKWSIERGFLRLTTCFVGHGLRFLDRRRDVALMRECIGTWQGTFVPVNVTYTRSSWWLLRLSSWWEDRDER